MADATIPDEFDSDTGQLDGYTAIKSGRYILQTSAGVFVDQANPTNDTDRLTPSLANRHIDVRSFITTDPDHGRPVSQMDLLHMMENAYHQQIASIGDAPTGGTWTLTWEDTGFTEYVLTDDYTTNHISSILHTVTRVGAGDIANGEVVYVSYTTGVASYENESVTMTGTTAQHLAHEAENVVTGSITVTKASDVITSGPIDWDATAAEVKAAIDAFVPQVFESAGYLDVRPAVIVTGSTFPYVVTFQDETVVPPFEIREIGSWAALFGVDDSSLTSVGTAELSIINLRTDVNFLQTADIDPSLTMEEVETVAGSVQEDWGTTLATGVTSFVVGKVALHNHWRGGVITFSGADVNAKFVSRTPLTPVNIEQLNSTHALTLISFIMPEWGTQAAHFVLANCSIQFTSDPNGMFADEGGTAADSTLVAFTGHITGVEFRAALTAFGSGCNWNRITGVRIILSNNAGAVSAPSAASLLTLMALRAVDDNWVATELDINTRTQHLESPVSLTGAAGDTGLAAVSPYIRSINPYGDTANDVSDNSGGDPSLSDGAVQIKFNSGTLMQVAGSEPTNHIVLYLRQRNTSGIWDWIQVQLSWGLTTVAAAPVRKAFIAISKITMAADESYTHTDDSHGAITVLLDNTDYLFKADASNTELTVTVAQIDSEGNTTSHYNSGAIESTNFERVRGRVGFYAKFDTDKDIEIDYLRSSNVSFATFRSAIFHSYTPIDGAQLFYSGSESSQLWESFELINAAEDLPTDDEMVRDTTKKIDSDASYKFVGGGLNTYSGLQSNIIDFDDWEQTFLDFDVWMPASLSAHNNVQELLIESTGTPSGGTLRLTHDGAETTDLPWDATAIEVQNALEALGTIGVGNVLCTQGPLPVAIIIKFIGALEGADVSTLTVSDNSITGSGVSTPVVTQAGVRPQIFLKQPGSELDYTTGTVGPFNINFVPGTWSHVHLDLGFLANSPSNPYRVQILTQQPSAQTWWVDRFKVGHRAIAWELRAIEDGAWFPFRDTVNDPLGALHLAHDKRGTAIQLQARALRADAWISNYTLKPHYAELGRVLPGTAPIIDFGGARMGSVITALNEHTP